MEKIKTVFDLAGILAAAILGWLFTGPRIDYYYQYISPLVLGIATVLMGRKYKWSNSETALTVIAFVFVWFFSWMASEILMLIPPCCG